MDDLLAALNNYGTIFSIPTIGGTPTILFNFDGTHGRGPMVR